MVGILLGDRCRLGFRRRGWRRGRRGLAVECTLRARGWRLCRIRSGGAWRKL